MRDNKNSREGKNIVSHLVTSRKLSVIERYHSRFQLRPTTVASHSWFVAKIVSHLAKIEKNVLGNKDLNVEKCLLMAINHDISEPYTGDIPSPVKNYNEEIKMLIKDLEWETTKSIIAPLLPIYEQEEFLENSQEYEECESLEAQIVKAADTIDRLFECADEIKLGNEDEFDSIVERDLEILMNNKLPSVKWFLYTIIEPLNLIKYLSEEDLHEYRKNGHKFNLNDIKGIKTE